MKGLTAVLFVCLIIFVSVNTGSALKCYLCASVDGIYKDCEDHPQKVETMECKSPLNACQILESDGVTTRMCALDGMCDFMEAGTYKRCKTCTTNLCNSALSPSYFTSLIISIGLFALLKLFT
ncbi:hypothetical protein NQ315_000389 [Exocentrus adspersus]|uniref:Protein sleepless n=1 Tax=Exocentrus adspersus TaxID=1586481 RepID=A0AAV8VLG1_9CUCU|nr:hypothetical protein NQ315_000389 [Exocentrus adspersus]